MAMRTSTSTRIGVAALAALIVFVALVLVVTLIRNRGSVTASGPAPSESVSAATPVAGVLGVRRSGPDLTIYDTLRTSPLVITATTDNAATNGGFNLISTMLAGNAIHDTRDDVTPIRTQMGTLGGNHGFTNVAAFANPDGKNDADLGSVWTDGQRRYVLLGFDETRPIMGGDYTRADGVTTSPAVEPVSELTHVSGGQHRAPINVGARSAAGSVQLYPSVGQVVVQVLIDGRELPAGNAVRGDEVIVRESYEVLDYGAVVDQAIAQPGKPYSASKITGAVKISNEYRFTGGGRTLVSSTLEALRPTELRATGFVQSSALTGVGSTTVRNVPGVRSIDGNDFGRGVDLASYETSTIVTSRDLIGDHPPTLSLDRLRGAGGTVAGFALGYVPTGDHDAGEDARAEHARSNLWELRSSGKSYPTVTTGEALAPGDRLSVRAFRVYLTAGDADAVAGESSAASAWKTLAARAALMG